MIESKTHARIIFLLIFIGGYLAFQFSNKALKIQDLQYKRNYMGSSMLSSKILYIGGVLENGTTVSTISSYLYDQMYMIFNTSESFMSKPRSGFLSINSPDQQK